MVRARPVLLAAAALLGCARMPVSREAWQRTNAWMMQPAPIRAPPGAQRPVEVRSLRLRAYADADYQAHAADWELRIRDQVRRANELLEVQFGIRFEVEVRPWDRSDRGGSLDKALRQLGSVERGGADCVVGFVGPVPEDAWRDHLGIAGAFGAEFVLRAMVSPAEMIRLAIGYDTMSDAERDAMADAWRVHRETVAFLHEWAHTQGAVHECDGKWIMAKQYGVVASAFSPESERLIRLTLEYRGKAEPEARGAFPEAWRAEVARMQSAAWECPVLEKDLAEQDAIVARAFEAREVREARAAWLGGLDRRIGRGWKLEKDACPGAAAERQTVDLEIHVDAAGALKEVRVSRSSGSEPLERRALEAVRATRFEPPPPSIVPPNGEIVFGSRFRCSGGPSADQEAPPRATPR